MVILPYTADWLSTLQIHNGFYDGTVLVNEMRGKAAWFCFMHDITLFQAFSANKM